MSNLNGVFVFIKEHCKEEGIPDKTCFQTLLEMKEYKDVFFPLYTYVIILEDFGLIEFNIRTSEISLTKKGRDADSVFDFLARTHS